MSSILTNTSAMTALETLRGINKGMQTVQSEIASGKRVANARDNAAVWAVAATMNSDVASFKTLGDSLSVTSATVGVARSVTEKIVDTLKDIKTLVVESRSPGVDATAYQTAVDEKIDLIKRFVTAAQFNGLNLLSNATDIDVVTSLDREGADVTVSTLTVSGADLAVIDPDDGEITAGELLDLQDFDVTAVSTTPADDALGQIEAMLASTISAAATFGAKQNALESQKAFVTSLVDSMNEGIGALTDTDMELASARLQALQVQQQLGVQALTIATQAPRALLSLFRG